MKLEELRAKRMKLENETKECLNKMDSIINESKRAESIAHAVSMGEDFNKYIGRL